MTITIHDYRPGIRSGDSVINTRDGAYTLFPTSQGLAFMNYQAKCCCD